jgi:N-methylhydantoinase B
VNDDDVAGLGTDDALPLYPGVVQRGAVAFAERSGTPLAIAPDHWTDGCAVLEQPLPERGPGPEIIVRAYLDPRTGRSLYVESVPAGEGRAFEVGPKRWTEAGNR